MLLVLLQFCLFPLTPHQLGQPEHDVPKKRGSDQPEHDLESMRVRPPSVHVHVIENSHEDVLEDLQQRLNESPGSPLGAFFFALLVRSQRRVGQPGQDDVAERPDPVRALEDARYGHVHDDNKDHPGAEGDGEERESEDARGDAQQRAETNAEFTVLADVSVAPADAKEGERERDDLDGPHRPVLHHGGVKLNDELGREFDADLQAVEHFHVEVVIFVFLRGTADVQLAEARDERTAQYGQARLTLPCDFPGGGRRLIARQNTQPKDQVDQAWEKH